MTFEDVKRIRKNPTAEDVDNRELHKLIDIALEKQIPKKPIEDRYPWCICPVCGGSVCLRNVQEHIMNLETTHCEHCGQAISWEGDE